MPRPIALTTAEVLLARAGKPFTVRRLMPEPACTAFWAMNGNGDKALHLANDLSLPGGISFVLWDPRDCLLQLRGETPVHGHMMPCPFGAPGDALLVQENWRSWVETCAETLDSDVEHACSEHCRQVYVAYEATPRVGYRPVPDRAHITYLDESSPLVWNKRLLGPWDAAETMPAWASRLSCTLLSIAVEKTADGWWWVLTIATIAR